MPSYTKMYLIPQLLNCGSVHPCKTIQYALVEETIMADEGRKGTSQRGFASMDREKQRAIASKGGKAAHEKGTAHEFSSEEAAAAGRKGGQARGQRRKQDMSRSSEMPSES